MFLWQGHKNILVKLVSSGRGKPLHETRRKPGLLYKIPLCLPMVQIEKLEIIVALIKGVQEQQNELQPVKKTRASKEKKEPIEHSQKESLPARVRNRPSP